MSLADTPDTAAERGAGLPGPAPDGPASPAEGGIGSRRVRSQLMVLLAVCCLALGGVFVRISEVGPVSTGAYRSLLAAPMLLGMAMATARRSRASDGSPHRAAAPIGKRDRLLIVLGGAFLAADLCLWHISFLYTSLAEANLLANLVPFIIAPLCFLLFGDRLPWQLALPALLALGGLYLLVVLGTGLDPDHLKGDLLALATAVFYALFLVVAKGLRERHEATRIMATLSLVCGAVCFAVAALLGETLWPTSLKGWLVLIALAVTSQLLGQTLMAHAVKFLPLQLAALFVLLQPVAAAVYGLVFFDQRLSPVQLAGIGVLLVSIFWAKNLLEGRK
ncbi:MULTISPECIES: DMT family transporter [Streptomyces]|uniref:DMT family transporter n=1 Tax=Streptomyces sudanensis TaxID=436397 RepID=A0ABY4T7H7_9ACTN|nr:MULTISPECIES: DMT family transporter [Streptomyces]MCP9957222.1 DMT family transporter [Streptomyces sudanensis]MCP9986377.1 DMT family transporter [Streptomyces sudanensis]MCQ0002215.1 DMT family transporter [Streptomyces sudanensis]URN14913.1 DMT family transporter [Streptomyces sudanensis]